MNEKPKKRELTAKQKVFVQAYTTPGKGLNNASQAYKIAYPNTKAGHNKLASRLMANDGIKAVIAEIRAELAAENGFTRETQLKDLEVAKRIAQAKFDSSGMVSATREQNEMLGFHRELAPNSEKEAAKRALISKEDKAILEDLAKIRLKKAAQAGVEGKTIKVGQQTG